MEIDRAWAENVFVTKANLLHSRVHDPEKYYTTAKKKVFTAVPVYRDEEVYNIYGITDCIEAGINNDGITLPGLPGKYQLSIVEYKPTNQKMQSIMRMILCRYLPRKFAWTVYLAEKRKVYCIMQM